MKNWIIVLSLCFSGNMWAQKISEKDVPEVVKNAFKTKYAGIKVQKWEKEGNLFEAEFKQAKVEHAVSFDASGKLMETEHEIKISELPAAVSAYIQKTYAGAEMEEASKITDANGKVSYEVEIETSDDKEMDLLFDASGHFLSVEKNAVGENEED